MSSRRGKVPPRNPAPRRQPERLLPHPPCHEVVGFTCENKCEFYVGPCTDATKYLVHQQACEWYTCHWDKREDGTTCTPGQEIFWHCQACERKQELDYLIETLPTQEKFVEDLQKELEGSPAGNGKAYYMLEYNRNKTRLDKMNERISYATSFLEQAKKVAEDYNQQHDKEQA